MASAELSRRVEKVVGHPPLSEMGDLQRREFHEALLDAAAASFTGGPTLAETLDSAVVGAGAGSGCPKPRRTDPQAAPSNRLGCARPVCSVSS